VTVGEAARLLGISKRQVRGFGRATRREGASTLAHGNRGRRPANAVAPEVGKQVIELATTTYQGFNRHHLTEFWRNERKFTSPAPPWTGD
jgi:transposase